VRRTRRDKAGLKHSLVFGAVVTLLVLVPAVASAGPVATSDGEYQALGRVFPDPQGACSSGPCSPRAQGNTAATSFIAYQEFVDALKYMNDPANGENSKAWSRYLEVWTLDGDLDGNETADGKNDIAPGTAEKKNFPGNDLGSWEFKPDGRAHSAGLPMSDLSRLRNDVFVLRVTDESVPDKDKKRMALSLSIHGIERAGVEGGTRAMEDLVTAVTTGKLGDPILATKDLGVKVPTFKDVLKHTIIYFTYPNPDGWRRGDLNDQQKGPGAYYQRYNGNGVDLNRDFPDIGFAFRPYSGLSEPESRGWVSAFRQINSEHGQFAAGDDLHGQLGADSFSYTLMPHGSHDFAKNERIREAAQTINLVQQDVLSWSPLIQANDQPRGSCNNKPVVGADCYPMYGQNWGTVYDTINYTTTGALGDFMDSSIGLNADGIDNEMSYSHLDKDVAFEPVIEQMHVDGNKGLIYAHLARILDPRTHIFPSKGLKGYVPNGRVKRAAKDAKPAPPGTHAQADIDEDVPVDSDGNFVKEFPVEESAQVYSGGLRVDVTNTNVQGIDPTSQAGHSLVLECKGCDRHRGIADEDDKDWTVVAEDFNQSGIYAQAGLTVAVNDPQPTGGASDTKWRAKVVGALPPQAHFHVEFSQGPATSDGATGGDDPPRLAAYDVASTDFWHKLNPFTTAGSGFQKVDPDKLARDADARVPKKLDSLVLTDEPLPGYSFPALPKVEVPADITAESQHPTAPCGYTDGMPHSPTCGESFDFKVDKEGLGRVTVTMTPTSGDLTLTVVKVADDGTEEPVGPTSDQGGDAGAETIDVAYPDTGNYRAYVDNWLAPGDSSWTATVHFEGPSIGDPGDASAYTDAEWERYAGKLAAFAKRGGNLVLTDGALQALPYLFDQIKRVDVTRNISYVGQVAFTKKATTSLEPNAEGNTLDDPLAKHIKLQGARFNSGLRRQTYEATPIGFAIQDETGGDANNSPQWVVDRKAFEAAGGRITATGTSGEADLIKEVTVGELKLGNGVVRIIGALLPEPTEKFDHQEGLEPFAVTYSGYSLAENLTDYCAPGHDCLNPPSVARCVGTLGFRSVSAVGRHHRRRVRFSIDRLGTAPVRIDVFQVSHGKRLFHKRRIKRFSSSGDVVTWNGRGRSKHRRATDGYYVVRFLTKTPTGHTAVHRIALRRRHARWRRVRDYQRRARCGQIRRFKLQNPVFGGTRGRRLKGSFRLSHAMPAVLKVKRGKRVVYRKRLKRARGGHILRFRVPLRKARGLYRVTLVAGRGATAARARLYSRRL
jgi:hypothetical protein